MNRTDAVGEVHSMGFQDVRYRGALCGSHIVRAIDAQGVVEFVVLSANLLTFHETFSEAEAEARERKHDG